MNKETGRPAFPVNSDNYASPNSTGMTLRQYAAIKLKVPDSGTDWLDNMIRQSMREDFAAKAMLRTSVGSSYEQLAKTAYEIADAMLKAREA